MYYVNTVTTTINSILSFILFEAIDEKVDLKKKNMSSEETLVFISLIYTFIEFQNTIVT